MYLSIDCRDFKTTSQQRQLDLSREQIPVLLQQLLVNTPQIFTPNYEQYGKYVFCFSN